MIRRYVVVPSRIGDVYAIAANLRPDDKAEITSLGADPRQALRLCFRNGIMRKTAFVQDEIAAMWGLCGVALGDIGEPYLVTTPAVERVPIAMLKEGRKSVAEMLTLKTVLVGHVAASYGRACRFLELLGFSLGEPLALGPKEAVFREFRIER